MEHLISAYLMQNKMCTLPQVGTLRIQTGSARVLTADKMIAGPVPEIEFDNGKSEWPKGLVEFLAAEKHITVDQASTELSAFCSEVQQIFGSTEIILPGTGRFYSDAEGILNFRQDPLPESFMPSVPAIRLVHPGSSHIMKVGDNEVSNHQMASRKKVEHSKSDHSWKIAAAVFLLISCCLILYYFAVTGPSGQFGNSRKSVPADEPVLYRIP